MLSPVKPLTVVYWSRVCLGILAALLCALLKLSSLLSGISFGILFYIITYYVLKRLFVAKVEKPSDIFKMGIGAYFLSWIVGWILFYSFFV